MHQKKCGSYKVLFVFIVKAVLLTTSLCSSEKSRITVFIHLNLASVYGDKHDEFSAIEQPNQQFATVRKTQRAIRELAYGATKIASVSRSAEQLKYDSLWLLVVAPGT